MIKLKQTHKLPIEEASAINRTVTVAHFTRQLQPDKCHVFRIVGGGQRSNISHAADDYAAGLRDYLGQVVEL